MVQGGCGSRLLLETMQADTVVDRCARENFDRDIAPEARIVSPIHFTHSADTEQPYNFIESEAFSFPQPDTIRLRGFKQIFYVVRRRAQQRLDLPLQGRIGLACLPQESSSFARSLLQGAMQNCLDLLPAFRGHALPVFPIS